jgi:hypothetical protein
VLLPWRNPLWTALVLHKLIRIVVPYLFIAGTTGSVWLALAHGGALVGRTVVAASVGLVLLLALRPSLLRSAAWAARLLTAPVIAAANALRRDWQVWRPYRPSVAEPIT